MSHTKSIQDSPQTFEWAGALDGRGAKYLRVLQFLEQAVADGRLRPGDRLPPQRQLAQQLGLDLTTVTRVYAEAAARHLVHAKGALGTFVASPKVELSPVLDLSMNLPPPPNRIDVGSLLRDSVAQLLIHADTDKLMGYQPSGGSRVVRGAGARWLAPILGAVSPTRISVAPGAQAALTGQILSHTRPGDVIFSEAMTYPGLLSASRDLARSLMVVERDASGMCPVALERACRESNGRVVYLNPTLQNPTAMTMPEHRRREIAKVAVKYDLQIIEDDPYWALADDSPPPFVDLAPERTHYISTLSKCLVPGLRTAFVVSPDERSQQQYLARLTTATLMSPPLETAIATQWILDGTAKQFCAGVRSETRARQEIAEQVLTGEGKWWPKGSIHLWYELPMEWTPSELSIAARMEGLAVASSEIFSVNGAEARAIRISLGGVKERRVLRHALQSLAELLKHGFDRHGRVHI